MTKEAITDLLEERHNTLLNWLNDQDLNKWEKGPENKWTTGQQTLHLIQSIKPVNFAMSLPKFVLKLKFGTSKREVRSYNAVVKRYQERLIDAKGMTFKASKNMKIPKIADKDFILNGLTVETKKLLYKIQKWEDKHLDNLILPHPLMGKMPIREILMWTSYHIEHHTLDLQENY
jgi:hypothetical protein